MAGSHLLSGGRFVGAPVTCNVKRPLVVIPDDVARFIARRFDPLEQGEAAALLHAATLHDGSPPGSRLLRCVVVASDGSIDRLRMEIETLKRDYRDVIVEGEYLPVGRELVKVRDLNQPISDDV
jgi:hypothetical protein